MRQQSVSSSGGHSLGERSKTNFNRSSTFCTLKYVQEKHSNKSDCETVKMLLIQATRIMSKYHIRCLFFLTFPSFLLCFTNLQRSQVCSFIKLQIRWFSWPIYKLVLTQSTNIYGQTMSTKIQTLE